VGLREPLPKRQWPATKDENPAGGSGIGAGVLVVAGHAVAWTLSTASGSSNAFGLPIQTEVPPSSPWSPLIVWMSSAVSPASSGRRELSQRDRAGCALPRAA
jgi:hypothetical protein